MMNENGGLCPDGEELHKEYMLFRKRVNDGWVFDRPMMIAVWAKFISHAKGCEQCGVEKDE